MNILVEPLDLDMATWFHPRVGNAAPDEILLPPFTK
jgi:hypothetical protein